MLGGGRKHYHKGKEIIWGYIKIKGERHLKEEDKTRIQR